MKVNPLRDLVLVEKENASERSAGGIYVPTTVEEKVITGKVLAVGPGKLTENGVLLPNSVKVGDRVSFNRSSSMEVKIGSDNFTLVMESSLLCTVTE